MKRPKDIRNEIPPDNHRNVSWPSTIVSFAALFSVMTLTSWAETISGLAWIVDGDTLEITGTEIRLHGIDAPERGQWCKNGKGKSYRCGEKSTKALKKITEGERVTCSINGRDKYGRSVGTCFFVSQKHHWGDVLGSSLMAMGGASEREVQRRLNRNPPKRILVKLNSWLVEKGYALAYRRYSTKYVQQEIEAKTKGRGIWIGEFTKPWRWRRGERLE